MSDRPPELDKLLDYVAGTITPEQEAFGIMATALIEAGDSSAAKAALIVKGIAEELKLRDAEISRLRASRNEVIEMCAKEAWLDLPHQNLPHHGAWERGYQQGRRDAAHNIRSLKDHST